MKRFDKKTKMVEREVSKECVELVCDGCGFKSTLPTDGAFHTHPMAGKPYCSQQDDDGSVGKFEFWRSRKPKKEWATYEDMESIGDLIDLCRDCAQEVLDFIKNTLHSKPKEAAVKKRPPEQCEDCGVGLKVARPPVITTGCVAEYWCGTIVKYLGDECNATIDTRGLECRVHILENRIKKLENLTGRTDHGKEDPLDRDGI